MTFGSARRGVGLAGLVLSRGGVGKLAIAGLVWRFLPRRLKRYAVGVAVLALAVTALVVVLVALSVSGSI